MSKITKLLKSDLHISKRNHIYLRLFFILLLISSSINSFSQAKSANSQTAFLSQFQGTWIRETGEVWYRVVITGTKVKIDASTPEMGSWGGVLSEECNVTEYGTTFSKINGKKLPFVYTNCDNKVEIYYSGIDPLLKRKEIAIQSNNISGSRYLKKVSSNYNPWN